MLFIHLFRQKASQIPISQSRITHRTYMRTVINTHTHEQQSHTSNTGPTTYSTDFAPGAASWRVTFTARHFLCAGTLRANMMSWIFNTPMRPSRIWVQEVVPSVRCLQRVFIRAKPKAACEPHCLSLAATSSSLSLCEKMTSSMKPEIRNILLRRQSRTEPRK